MRAQMKNSLRIHAVALLFAAIGAAHAADKPAPADPAISPFVWTQEFLDAHPDLKYRSKGVAAFDRKEFDAASKYFQRAAFYADKPSQGMLAELFWNGDGGLQDRALGYVWMDLAAERGYQLFVEQRERYWGLLDDGEKARAIEQGRALRALYGDAAARPRIDRLLRRKRSEVTGSHLGSTVGSALTIQVPGPAGSSRTIDGSLYFDPKFWDPKRYQAWQDAVWSKSRNPRVSVGELETVKPDAAADTRSRLPQSAPQVDAAVPEVPDEKR
jgi:hypothetical protein